MASAVETPVVDQTPAVQQVDEVPIVHEDVEVFTPPEALAPPEPTPVAAVEVDEPISEVVVADDVEISEAKPASSIITKLKRERSPETENDTGDSPLGLDNKKLLMGLFAAFVVVMVVTGIRVTGVLSNSSLVTSLEQGDCIEDFFTPNQGEFREVFLVGTTDCSNPHAYEVYAVGESVYAESEYPGIDGVFEVAQSYCDQQYNSFVGGDFLSSPWNVWTFAPTEDRWNAGERNVQCIVGDFDQTTLTTGTLRNAGR